MQAVLFVYRQSTVQLITRDIFFAILKGERNTEETMSLLNKIAISNGNKVRKAAANRTIAAMDGKKVAAWHRSLQDTIQQKKRMEAIPLTDDGK